MKRRLRLNSTSLPLNFVLCFLISAIGISSAFAIDVQRVEPKLPDNLQSALEKVDFAAFDVRPRPVKYEMGMAAGAGLPWWPRFESTYSDRWQTAVDIRTNRPLLIEGKGIPWLPGTGNQLTLPAFGAASIDARGKTQLDSVAEVANAFIESNRDVLGVSTADLVLDQRASNGFGRNNRYWNLQYQFVIRGPDSAVIPVRDARVFFRVSHGNLIQFGNHLAVEPQDLNFANLISREQAIARASELLGNPGDIEIADAVRDVGQADRSLQVVPENRPDGSLGHRLVRSLNVHSGDIDVELWLDAHTGELIFAINNVRSVDAEVEGGIYPVTNTDPEVLRGLPYIEVDNNGVDKDADMAGVYDYAPVGSLASAALEGDYVRVNDNCGTSSVSTSLSPGNLNFGRGSGTDCDTPGFGGTGNTHAARSSYYHLNLIKDKARAYLDVEIGDPHWLNNQLEARTNLTGDCNAFWSPALGVVKFYQTFDATAAWGIQCPTDATLDYLCSNTGEIAGVFLHEFGHGLDDNTNGAPPENGSGEAYGDTMAFLQTHDSCIGNNFAPGCACQFGCDAGCTGVRDVAVDPDVRPDNIDEAPADCDRFACPYFSGIWPYQGPMGYQGHCESLVASGAVWDMIQGFVARYGEGAGWALGDRIWYESLNQTQSAYQITDGGTCNPDADVDGCGADNWYTVFLALDDDNGDLTDGTPNADIIWNAFNDHGIACGAAAPAVHSTCPALGIPVLAAVADAGQVELNWTAVPDAVTYRVYRNEFGCASGSAPIVDVATPAATYTDTAVNNGTTYYYGVQAIGTDDICVSAFSACLAASPDEPLSPSNIFMVLDHSGSMSGTTDVAGERKIDALHDAALMVVDLVEDYAADGFRLGAVSFSTTATGTESLKDASVAAEKTALETFITDLEPTNRTAIGQGINQALTSFPGGGNQKVIMLLSNGIQNEAPLLELQVPPPGVAVGGTDLPADVRFYTVALGTNIEEDLFDDLATQGGIPGFYFSGGTPEIQANFAFWIADVLGLDPAMPLTAPPGSSLAAPISGIGVGQAERYLVNPTVRRATFLVTWLEKGRDLRFHLETPVGRIDPPESSFHPEQGFAAYTIELPLPRRAANVHIGEWRLVVDEAASPAAEGATIFQSHALFDDPALSVTYAAGGGDPGAGESLPLKVEVMENGNPVSGLLVTAEVVGPQTGLGDILSEALYDPRKAVAVTPVGDQPVSAAWDKLAYLLEQNPDLIPMLPPNTVSLTESRPGVYEATIPASTTEASGTYDFAFQLAGSAPQNGQVARRQEFSRYLRVKPDVTTTLATAKLLDNVDQPTVRVVVTPLDLNGHRLGPGWDRYVRPTPAHGQTISDVVDQLDGSYRFDLAFDTTPTTSVLVDVLGTTIEVEVPAVDPGTIPWWVWLLLALVLLILILIIMARRNP